MLDASDKTSLTVPFREWSKMDSRRMLASRVLDQGWSVASAAREAGVSRQTAHLWVSRAREKGIAEISEGSKRPKRSPRLTDSEVVAEVLQAAEANPYWGPALLYATLWPAGDGPVCERTVARILARAGRRLARPPEPEKPPKRFERDVPNELWQMDFKRLGPRGNRAETANVVDDASRYALVSRVVPDQTLGSAWSAFWDACAEYGMPEAVLSDNGSAFRNNATWRWSTFDLRLMILGVRPCHGRPYHPQTQGKVERFHGTLQRELVPTLGCESDLTSELGRFRNRYNWQRPHRALGMKTPGSAYRPSPRTRPERMPEPFFPQGAEIRKAQDFGLITYRGTHYRLGRAFAGLPVGILTGSDGVLSLAWGDFILAPLQDLKV